MVIGALQLKLHFPVPQSLKEKRFILQSLLARFRQRFNAGIAELEGMDLWQTSVLATVCVGRERRKVEQLMEEMVHFFDQEKEAQVLDQQREIL